MARKEEIQSIWQYDIYPMEEWDTQQQPKYSNLHFYKLKKIICAHEEGMVVEQKSSQEVKILIAFWHAKYNLIK